MKEIKKLDSENTIYTNASIQQIETFSKTMNLRWFLIETQGFKLQQMWQGDAGTQKWEDVETVRP